MGVSNGSDSHGRGGPWIGVVLYLVFACVLAFGTPPMTGPDEGAHAVYIRVVASEWHLPDVGFPAPYSETATATHQAQHPPGYYMLCAPLFRLLDSVNISPWPALRLLGVLIGAATVVVVWRIGRVLFPEGSLAIRLSATAGMVPIFQYMTAMLNNIGLAILLAALVAHRLAIILRGRDGTREWIILGIVLGLASLTSLMGLALCVVPVALLAMRFRLLGVREALLRLAVVVGGPVILAGWWFARNYMVCGTLTPMFRSEPLASVDLPTLLISQPLAALKSAGIVLNNGLVQLWSCTWLMRETGAPAHVVALIYLVAYVGFGLFVAGGVRAAMRGGAPLRAWALLGVFACLIVFAGVVRQVWFVDAQVADFAGRYFVILVPFAIPLVASSLEPVKPRRVAARVWLAVLWAFLVAANAAHAAYVVWFFHRA